MTETTEASFITDVGISLADQLWAMAHDGKSLKEIGAAVLDSIEARDPIVAVDVRTNDPTGMNYAVVLLVAGLGIGLVAP